MSDFDDILNIISSNQKKANPTAQINYQTNEPQFNPIPPQNFKRPSPPKEQASDSLLRIEQMQKRLNMSPSAIKSSVPSNPVETAAVEPPPINRFVSPTITRFQNEQAIEAAGKLEKPESPEPAVVETVEAEQYDEPKELVEKHPPKAEHIHQQNRISMPFSQAYDQVGTDLHETDQKSISILQREVQQANSEKEQLRAKVEALEKQILQITRDKDAYQEKCEELEKTVEESQRQTVSERPKHVESVEQVEREIQQLQERSPELPTATEEVEGLSGSLQQAQSRFLTSQVLPPQPAASTTGLEPNCFKILPPEGTQLREEAAKRYVTIEKKSFEWGRIVDGQVKESGAVQFGEIIHCLFGEDASIFRSKVLAARRAGYCNSVFELIESGILDQIECKNIGGEMSVVLFLAEKILIFEFQDDTTFSSTCKALIDAGL